LRAFRCPNQHPIGGLSAKRSSKGLRTKRNPIGVSEPRFLDSNVPLRFFTQSDPDMAEAARAVLERVNERTERVLLSVVVVLEVVFTLERSYRVPKARIREMMRDLVSMPGVQLADKHLSLEALDLYVDNNISFGDAYNAALMRAQGLDEVYSWDTDFDRIPGIRRIPPG
jgi:uncharacterized protein